MSYRAIIKAWPSISELATDLGVAEKRVRMWHYRDSIPSAHWPKLVSAANRRGFDGVTLAELAALAAERRAA